MAGFVSSTVPGCRTPHIWLEDGASLYDELGPEYTLLRFDRTVAVEALQDAAMNRNVPLQVLDVDSHEATSVYTTSLVLSRPDRHVAWRGDRLPDDPLALVDLVRGASAG